MRTDWPPRVTEYFSDSRLSFLGALVVSLLAFGVYLHTLAPSVTWKHDGADSGDLATAAFTLGIPHPPGYPLFTLLAAPFARLPGIEPAQGVAIFAALAGALAIFVLARAASSLAGPRLEDVFAQQIPNLAALAFAFAPAVWSQATIAEVYTLNLFFVSVVLWAMVSQTSRRVAVAAAAFGFGLAHHPSIMLLAPGAWLALRPTRRDLRVLILLLAPLAIYVYLPLRAAALPPVNWGNPINLEGFLWDVTAAPYRSYLLDLPLADIVGRIAFSARLMFDQFTPIGVGLAIWGAARLIQSRQQIGLALILNVGLVSAYAVIYGSRDSFIYLLPAFSMMMLWAVYGAFDLVRLVQPEKPISTPVPRVKRRRQTRTRIGGPESVFKKSGNVDRQDGGVQPRGFAPAFAKAASPILAIAVAALAFYNLWTNFQLMDLAVDREARAFAQGIIEKVPDKTIIFAEGDEELFALVYYRYAIAYDRSNALIVSQGLLQHSWYYDEMKNELKGANLPALGADSGFHERAVAIVESTNAQGRLNCFADSSPLLEGYNYEDRFGLKCVAGRK